MAYCENCGALLGENVKFCGQCGAPVKDGEEVKKYCKNCHAQLEPGAIFCPECGYRVQGHDKAGLGKNELEETRLKEAGAGDIEPDEGADAQKSVKNEYSKKAESAAGEARTDKKAVLISNAGLPVLLVLLIFIFSAWSGRFLNSYVIGAIIREWAVVGIAAAGTALVMLNGGVDLSVGAVMSVTAMIAGSLVHRMDMPFPVSILLALSFALGYGLLNGVCIAIFKIPFFITTLGMGVVLYGLSNIIGGYGGMYMLPGVLTQGTGIGWFLSILLLAAGASLIFLYKTDIGKGFCVSEEIEDISGNGAEGTARKTIFLYSLSGLSAGIAGLLLMLRVRQAYYVLGQNYELYAITAALLGGVYLKRGKGQFPAVLAGALLVAVWNIGITVCLGGARYDARVFEGLFLIAAVLYLQFTRKLYDRVKK